MAIYIAGPAVFEPDFGDAHFDRVRKLLAQHGVAAICPTDKVASGALGIRNGNIELIKQADAIIADLSPFRSKEPDCGTAFEVGYAAALGKTLLVYSSDLRTMREKYGGGTDAEGKTVEDFGLPFNLMLSDGTEIFGSFDSAFAHYLTLRKK